MSAETASEQTYKEKMFAIVRKDAPGTILGLQSGHLMIFNSEREAWAWMVRVDDAQRKQLAVQPIKYDLDGRPKELRMQ